MKKQFRLRCTCLVLSVFLLFSCSGFAAAAAADEIQPEPIMTEGAQTADPAAVSVNSDNETRPVITAGNYSAAPSPSKPPNFDLLLNLSNNTDVDFIPSQGGDTWFEYDYGKEVKITGVSMLGWWPTCQGVKVLSFQYFDGTDWQNSDQNVTIPWNTPTSTGGPVPLTVPLSADVTCSKFRIVVNSTYTLWSQKCCMYALVPAVDPGAHAVLAEKITEAQALLSNAQVGTDTYQYPQAAYDDFAAAIAAAIALHDNPSSDETDYRDALTALTQAQELFLASENLPGRLSEPEITLHGLTSSDNVMLLVNGGEFNFYSGKDVMTNAYLEYNYINTVKIYSLDMLGWWPKDQGVKNLSFSYYLDGEWHDGDQNVAVPWKTISGNGATSESPNGEPLTLSFTAPVECTRLRIYVNSAFHSWSDKICMSRMEPRGDVIKDVKSLYDAVRSSQKYVDGLLVGNRPGEFPQDAVDAFAAVVDAAIAALNQPDLTESELNGQIEAINAAMEVLIDSQNPRDEYGTMPQATLEGMELVSGVPFCLADGQLATRLEMSSAEGETSAILLDYSRPYTLSGLTLISDQPMTSAVKRLSLQYWDGSAWQETASEITLSYKGTVPNFEGASFTLAQPVTAQRFRLVLLEGYGETYGINELLTAGSFAVDASALNAAIQRTENALAKAQDRADRTVDMANLKLASARNEDFLDHAFQSDIDALTLALNDVAALLEKLVPDEPFPVVPVDPEPVAELPFTDVPEGSWSYAAISFVYEHGLMKGVSSDEFAPNSPLSRAMLMTILARLDGVDTSGGVNWYEKGMNWAVEKGVSDGSNPTQAITREQFVTMLYRYAGKPEAAGDHLAGCNDAALVSGWAKDAMNWAVAEGIITGRGNSTLVPGETATRAEAAAMLMRFISCLK